ncbi:HTH-type transcriptional regulator SgrR [Heracleum sosnowskyi]|uniref:HTH-type transcriptional regulator SgrR n=1 Tax=Heracleum sosnowskyi TaxID=360622 RepID=A0AAD8IM54_9APIA|nr:HTH-type transcriptional regulator SgrR [Heracleum sosnowskyi]
MVRPLQIQVGHDHHLDSSIGLAIGLFVSASVVATLCAKHARRVSRNYSANSTSNGHDQSLPEKSRSMQENHDQKMVPKSPLRSPKKFITSLSNKAITPFFMYHKKSGDGDDDQASKGEKLLEEEGFGQGGLWQKDILMGEKCQPHEFSGVIYYDCDGKQISELPPRSPRASTHHVPAFSFPVLANDEN